MTKLKDGSTRWWFVRYRLTDGVERNVPGGRLYHTPRQAMHEVELLSRRPNIDTVGIVPVIERPGEFQ